MVEKMIVIILPILLGALLTSIITRKHKDKERLQVASDNFHHSFLETLNLFSNQAIVAGLYEHLVSSFGTHKNAVIDFRRHLNWFWRRGFDKAWNNYRYGINKAYPPPETEFPIPHLVCYAEGLKWDETRESTKKLVLGKIHRILHYAKAN